MLIDFQKKDQSSAFALQNKKWKNEDMKTILLESILSTQSKNQMFLPSNPTSRNLLYKNYHLHQNGHHYISYTIKIWETT